MKKIIALGLAAIMMAATVAGCSKEKPVEDGKVTITIGDWPDETWSELNRETFANNKAAYEAKYPDRAIITDTSNYRDAKIFATKAAANQLPSVWTNFFTEIQQVVKSGYAKDITKIMKDKGYTDAINPDILELLKGPDGKIYAFPASAYIQGLTINQDIFKQAGLVNEDGTIKVPDTYQEVAEFSKIIREKTGKAGLVLCTSNNCGGWQFMNIAWSFGVEFMKQREDGTWEATFNTPEAVEALQYIKDLKWKYDALVTDTVIDQKGMFKYFGAGHGAMMISDPNNGPTASYDLPHSAIYYAKMPAGPKGRYVQMGGDLYIFNKNATDAEVEACIDWLEVIGKGINVDEKSLETIKASAKATNEKKGVVLPGAAVPTWKNSDRWAKEIEAKKEYENITMEQCESYFDTTGCIIKPEEPVACQQLYSVLDGCIQEVITNENADCAKLIETACNDFQVNHLDKQ